MIRWNTKFILRRSDQLAVIAKGGNHLSKLINGYGNDLEWMPRDGFLPTFAVRRRTSLRIRPPHTSWTGVGVTQVGVPGALREL